MRGPWQRPSFIACIAAIAGTFLLTLSIATEARSVPEADRASPPTESARSETATTKPTSAGAARADATAGTEVEPNSAPGPSTFEALARTAVPMADLGTLLAPFAGKCEAEQRELDRVRCRTTRAYLRKVIPQRSFWAVVDDPATITVSDFDAAIKGYHLSVSACLACTRPVTVGRSKEKRLITLKAPQKEAESLHAAVEISRNSVAFESLPEAKAWLDHSRPDLRTQFVFRPAETEWSFGPSRGYALTLLGMRVFNRCTGEVLVSRPPSTGIADMPGIEEGCGRRNPTDDAADHQKTGAAAMPTDLSKNEISQAMTLIRPQVFACFEKFNVPGVAQFDFVVAGNGTVSTVRLSGAFYGTPTGTCLIEAAQNAHFPRFSNERQRFTYPFFLRR